MASDDSFEFRCIARDLKGAEGPVFTRDGQFYMVSPTVMKGEKYAGHIVKVDLETEKVSIHCEPSVDGCDGIPAGCQSDKENNIWVADMMLGILKVSPDGTCQQIAKVDSKGECMQGCNDCIFDYNGTLWVTAPAGNIAPHPFRRSVEEPFGSVYCMTKDGQIHKIDTGYLFSNGIAVQHDSQGRPAKLIVAETHTHSLWGYDIEGPGKVTNKHLWGKLPDEPGSNGPDGMDFDEEGNLIVAHHAGGHLEIFGPQGGAPISRVVLPFKMPSNVHFKPNSNVLYITEHDNDALWVTTWKCKGKKQYCEL